MDASFSRTGVAGKNQTDCEGSELSDNTETMRRRIVQFWISRHTVSLNDTESEYLTDLLLSDLFPAPTTATWTIPTPAPMTVQISPETSVEPVVSTLATLETADAPAEPPSGETQEELIPDKTSPAPLIIPQPQTVIEPSPVVVVSPESVEKPTNQPGSSGAIYEARMYALSQIEKGNGIHTRIIANLTGWDAATVRKFVCEIQDEWKRRKECKKSAEVETGYISVVDILLAATEEIEDEEEVIEPAPEPVTEKPSRGLPPWWSQEMARYCPVCHLMIQPAYYEGCQKWEQKDAYLSRKSCGKACSKKLRKPE